MFPLAVICDENLTPWVFVISIAFVEPPVNIFNVSPSSIYCICAFVVPVSLNLNACVASSAVLILISPCSTCNVDTGLDVPIPTFPPNTPPASNEPVPLPLMFPLAVMCPVTSIPPASVSNFLALLW